MMCEMSRGIGWVRQLSLLTALLAVLISSCANHTVAQEQKAKPQALSGSGEIQIDFEWVASTDFLLPGEFVDIELYARSDEPASLKGLELIFTWDESKLVLNGLDNTGVVPHFVSRFRLPGGPCSLNDSDPPTDGDGLYSWSENPFAPVTTTPEGILLTRFRFQATDNGGAQPTIVEMEIQIQKDTQTCDTLITVGDESELGNLDYKSITIGCQEDSQCQLPETCDEQTNRCVECIEAADCTNGIFCDGQEQCIDGACQPGTPPCVDLAHCDEGLQACLDCIADEECNDNDDCTVDQCDDNECVFTQALPGSNDFDFDNDVDLLDYAMFEQCLIDVCLTTPCYPPVYQGVDICCEIGDSDQDGDVDLKDFGIFQIAFTSP